MSISTATALAITCIAPLFIFAMPALAFNVAHHGLTKRPGKTIGIVVGMVAWVGLHWLIWHTHPNWVPSAHIIEVCLAASSLGLNLVLLVRRDRDR